MNEIHINGIRVRACVFITCALYIVYNTTLYNIISHLVNELSKEEVNEEEFGVK